MPKSRAKAKESPIVGVWRSIGDFGSQVEYHVRKKGSGYSVSARDVSDGELAEVFEVKWDAKACALSFAVHWSSTGRFARCRLQLTEPDQVELTYTFTDTEPLVRRTGGLISSRRPTATESSLSNHSQSPVVPHP